MSMQEINASLQQLLELHQSLYSISKSKTDVLKDGDTDELQQLLKKEKKHVQAVNQIEKRRLEQVSAWATSNQLDLEEPNVTSLLEVVEDTTEKQQLEDITTQLAEVLVNLKQQEQLNQQLTHQSLQFVQLSMNMIAPTIQSFNYGNQNKLNSDKETKRSVFDSKA
ncbi:MULTISPECIES: flagellar protein FlgN [Paraliobacillus]|uniref:flagellar protein FlgN n=1 Tax=Paraliobacillus TaxID=200903 RepID=UPI000E3B7C7F|nr:MULTISPECIES: flagellar protein FlgN [Paraliobacillus]